MKNIIVKILLLLFLISASVAQAATLLPNGEQVFLDNNGIPVTSGSVTFYIPGTTVLKTTWQDAGQTISNTNPVILNSAGRAIIYGSGSYRQIVKDSLGNTIWDRVTADTSASSLSWAGISGGSGNAQTVAASNFSSQDGQIIGFIAGFSNSGAMTISPNGVTPIAVVKDTGAGPVALTGGEVVANNSVLVLYDASAGVFHIVGSMIPSTISVNTLTASSITDTGPLLLTGTITPAALVANTNDWNPTSFSTATIVRMSASSAINVTGITARATGTVVNLQNVGTNNMVLTSNDAASAAANRFNFPWPVTVFPGTSVLLQYDGTTTNWRLMEAKTSQPVAVAYKKLVVTTVTDTTVNITADEIALEDLNGYIARASSVNVTCTVTNAGANGLDTGAAAASTWYSDWVIFNPTTNAQACLQSLSTTAPTMPSGYTYKARVGWSRYNVASKFLRTIQYGKSARYVFGVTPLAPSSVDTLMASGVAGNVGTPTMVAVPVAAFVPSATASHVVLAAGSAAPSVAEVWPNNSASWGGNASADSTWCMNAVNNQGVISCTMMIESANVYWASNNANGHVNALGWEDNL